MNQIILGSGNYVSTSALFWASVYGVNVIVVGKTGRPLSIMLPLSVDKRVKTRVKQYEAYQNTKGTVIAKTIVEAKISSQISLLNKYYLDTERLDAYLHKLKKLEIKDETIDEFRLKLTVPEGHCTKHYFKQYFTLFPKYLQPKKREKYKAISSFNNLLNLGYEILKGEIYKAVLNAHLDPYLGFLHSIQFAKPSLVCDIQEIFKVLIEDFLVTYHKNLDITSFEQNNRRSFLKSDEKLKMILAVNKFLDQKIDHPSIRNYGDKSKIRAIIQEEPIKMAQHLRENKVYNIFQYLITS